MRDDGVSGAFPQDGSAVVDLAFAAFVLAHTACEDATVELRLDEDLLVEWCPACAALGVFVASGNVRGIRSRARATDPGSDRAS